MSQVDEFDVAGESTYVDMAELVGELILFTPSEYIEKDEATGAGINTENGLKDAVITDMDVITKGESHESVMILQGSLIGVLKRRVPTPAAFTGTDAAGNKIVSEAKPGRKMLGVLGKGEVKKKGWNAPYVLQTPTPVQIQQAKDFLAGRIVASAAAPAAADPAEDPWAVTS